MSQAILATMLGRTVTLFASCGKLAAPYLTSASKPSRQALVPLVKMLPMRHDCHGLHYLAGFACLRAKLDNLSALPSPREFQGFPEDRRHVKLDHLCHNHPFFSLQTFADGPRQPYHIRTELQPTRIAQPESEQNCSLDPAYSSVPQQEVTLLLNGLQRTA
jgi:hypothetical protein